MTKLMLLTGAIVGAVGLVAVGQPSSTAQEPSVVLVYVEGSTVSSFSGAGNIWGAFQQGGSQPQTIEVMKQMRLSPFCSQVQITANREAADYLVLHERQSAGGNRNNIAVFAKDDMLLYADGARRLDNAVKDMCRTGPLQ